MDSLCDDVIDGTADQVGNSGDVQHVKWAWAAAGAIRLCKRIGTVRTRASDDRDSVASGAAFSSVLSRE